MLLLQGECPYSDFREKKLYQTLQRECAAISSMSVHYAYFVLGEQLSDEEFEKLRQIVDLSITKWQGQALSHAAWVTPRFGTLSPWSSKATDILQVCGLYKVERIERGFIFQFETNEAMASFDKIAPLIHDRMTQACSWDIEDLQYLFQSEPPQPSLEIKILENGLEALQQANQLYGLALTDPECSYLYTSYQSLGRNPSIAELMMFGQINSEHCRHKIFNASWTIDGIVQPDSLFAMIRNTHKQSPAGVISAYKDNGAIIAGQQTATLFSDPHSKTYRYYDEPAHIVIKVETHNHPTAIAPFEGAATGSGGEIRDEGATGIGAKPKAGLVGFSVSNLHIPKLTQAWENPIGYPSFVANSLEIMLQAPIGAASFNNEFGRPSLLGYFRTFEFVEQRDANQVNIRGYHKPIMIAGGLGQIRPQATTKKALTPGMQLIVLGGPAMLIGLGGGAASSLSSGSSHQDLDFASVQRSNPEMQRRAQEVINTCWSLGDDNPIISIHDVGAGGLSNALSELVHDSECGGTFQLRAVPSADPSLNAMQIWCNEAQERYVLGIKPSSLELFAAIAKRERCPFAVVGQVEGKPHLTVHDEMFREVPIDVPMEVLFGEASKMYRNVKTKLRSSLRELEFNHFAGLSITEIMTRILQLPSVADKSFLITIGDRTVGGLVARDQMVGPWQVPVADVAVTASGYEHYNGEAMAMGERSPIALLNAAASARMAVAEAITNILAADIQKLGDIKLSANWMAAANYDQEDVNLFEAVKAIGLELCPSLGICIPVGKDSLSMQMKWQKDDKQLNVAAPLSLIISAFAPVQDIRRTLTPLLTQNLDTELMLIDLGEGKNRLGGSAFCQVIQTLGNKPPDVDNAKLLIKFFTAITSLRAQNLLLSYHDRSDGGLFTTLCEMSFASHCGLSIDLDTLGNDAISILFNEELGAVIQYAVSEKEKVLAVIKENYLEACCHVLGRINNLDTITFSLNNKPIINESRVKLQRLWSATSYHLQSLRDNPDCAQQEYNLLLDQNNPGLHSSLSFSPSINLPAVLLTRPKVAILREQGVNGHYEMAAAFERVGFEAIDVHMTDILEGAIKLNQFQGIVACGGFSYGDVLGAGRGWANSILYNPRAVDQFSHFFNLPSVFVLGVCNGCQMLSHLKNLIPGAQNWPTFIRNQSEQFEARLSLVKIQKSRSIFFKGMEDSILPVVVSHGEGQVFFEDPNQAATLNKDGMIALQYVDNYEQITTQYPSNPNGSVAGITALTNADGRFTIMMPHPERVFRTHQFSWFPEDWDGEHSPWMKLFLNAREWLQ